MGSHHKVCACNWKVISIRPNWYVLNISIIPKECCSLYLFLPPWAAWRAASFTRFSFSSFASSSVCISMPLDLSGLKTLKEKNTQRKLYFGDCYWKVISTRWKCSRRENIQCHLKNNLATIIIIIAKCTCSR